MSKLGDKLNDGKIVGWTLIGAAVLAGGGLGVAALASANAAPAAIVQTVEPIDFAALPYTNGLAGEQETEAATAVAAEQARAAAEATAAAEAARVAAEQAAAVEAERIAVEQAAADEPDDPGPVAGGGGLPAGAVPPNVPGSDQPDSTACASSSLTWDGTQSVCG
ncbi:hypothetical protein ACFWWU_36550 [Streptomyces sp. NPDC058650]|uniref:hypothetical protein n=1 Tax=Streptomyces sp. NPDC058650 TaxID=3346575 RepID=UPI0036591D8E